MCKTIPGLKKSRRDPRFFVFKTYVTYICGEIFLMLSHKYLCVKVKYVLQHIKVKQKTPRRWRCAFQFGECQDYYS